MSIISLYYIYKCIYTYISSLRMGNLIVIANRVTFMGSLIVIGNRELLFLVNNIHIYLILQDPIENNQAHAFRKKSDLFNSEPAHNQTSQ